MEKRACAGTSPRSSVARPTATRSSSRTRRSHTSGRRPTCGATAPCGVPFGKMSGRGLGHTGGTLDKLEAIPGFRVELSTDEFTAQVHDIGIAVVGQTANLVPADKKL